MYLVVLFHVGASRVIGQRIHTHRCSVNSLGIDKPADFALAFYSAHEVPDAERLLREIHGLLRAGRRFLVVEPVGHVTKSQFSRMVTLAEEVGFHVAEGPQVRLSHTVVLLKR
jgi:hypothetical protein